MTKKSNEIIGIGRFKIHKGKTEEYKRLHAEVLKSVRTKDKGTLQFDLYFNDDESECFFIERYKDSDSLIQHVNNLGDLFGKIVSIVTVIHGEILGNVSPELKAKMAGGPVSLFKPYQTMEKNK